MAAGTPYFAWIDQSETTFTSAHLRWDEQIFSFTLKQDEGDPAALTVVVRRPRNSSGDPIGLLGPGRKIWCWFAFDCGPALIKFRGRLVGIPTSIFEELVTLDFVARPIDLVAQKNALANSLRVLPYYDETVIDPTRRSDPEVVLEGYSKNWSYDRETHIVSVSDELTGEDGLVEFNDADAAGKVLYDGLGLTLSGGPLTRVDVSAEYTWTQMALGQVDLTRYLTNNWPDLGPYNVGSYTFSSSDWPKVGATLGDGWVATQASAAEPFYQAITVTEGGGGTVIFPDTSWFGPSQITTSWNNSRTSCNAPGMVFLEAGKFTWHSTTDGTALSTNSSQSASVLVLHEVEVTLVAGYTANRQCTESVSFSLYADVQSILTEPEDGEALRIEDIRSVNLSEAIDGVIPIGDPARRSYIATARGNQSLEHLIALARANLMKRSRVVEIAFAPQLSRMPEITLRKNALLLEPRVGEALGKIIGYQVALDGSDGRVKCEVRIGCAIGRGGSNVATAGTPTYCTVDYAGVDYQEFSDRVVLFGVVDSSVGYQPPIANPNDDGLNFLSGLRVEDVIDIPLSVENPASVQQDTVAGANTAELAGELLGEVPTKATFKLKSMTRDFNSDYPIAVTHLKIPTGYDLEAV